MHAPPYPAWLDETSHHAPSWTYNKTENVTPAQLTANRRITHAIAEIAPSSAANSFDGTGFPKSSWRLTGVVAAFDRLAPNLHALQLDYTRPWEVLQFVKSEKLAILERK